MIRRLLAVAAFAVSTAFGQNASQILEGARIAATLQQTDLHGNLSKNGVRTPVHLYLRGKDIQLAFDQGGATQRFHLRLGDGKYDLFDIADDGKTTRFPNNKLTQPIAGSDMTYEDLSFRFFYWPDPIFEGEDKIAGQPCYKIRLNKPKGDAGRYEVVYVWVHVKYGAFMQVRGHNKAGRLVKQFQVEDVMQIGNGVWTLRKMQISSHDPGTEERIGITSLIFDTPKSSRGPKGLR
jgi:hypothetical protein